MIESADVYRVVETYALKPRTACLMSEWHRDTLMGGMERAAYLDWHRRFTGDRTVESIVLYRPDGTSLVFYCKQRRVTS